MKPQNYTDDDDEFNELADQSADPQGSGQTILNGVIPYWKSALSLSNFGTTMSQPAEKVELPSGYCQWGIHANGQIITPSAVTVQRIPPGYYRPDCDSSIGFHLDNIPLRTEGILEFPHTNSETIMREIVTFWDREPYFRKFDLAFKRGILLWGPPGSGKSSLLQLIARDVISRHGVVLEFNELIAEAIRLIDDIQPGTPKVVFMEDLDAMMEHHSKESSILNILDGAQKLDKVIFLATTNYPEKLGERIKNRPSRFDKRFKIGLPTLESRSIYLQSLAGKDSELAEGVDFNLERWAEDTKDFSLAHIKELFTAVVILGNDYDDSLKTLKKMNDKISSDQDKEARLGFRG